MYVKLPVLYYFFHHFTGKSDLPSNHDSYVAGSACVIHRQFSYINRSTTIIQRRRSRAGRSSSWKFPFPWLLRSQSQMMSALEDNLLTVTSYMACQTAKGLSGLKLLTRGITVTSLPVMELKGWLAQLSPPFNTTHSPQNRVILSNPVSLSSLSSWMNAGVRATMRMTEVSWGPLATITDWCSARDSPWKFFESDKGERVGIRFIKVSTTQDDA